jgi:hypothetical protein
VTRDWASHGVWQGNLLEAVEAIGQNPVPIHAEPDALQSAPTRRREVNSAEALRCKAAAGPFAEYR